MKKLIKNIKNRISFEKGFPYWGFGIAYGGTTIGLGFLFWEIQIDISRNKND